MITGSLLLLTALFMRHDEGAPPELRLGQAIEGEITDADPVLAPSTPALLSAKVPVVAKTYRLAVGAPGPMWIELRSTSFNPYLVLRDDDGNVVAEDNDGGIRFNARIVVPDLAPGLLSVHACALGGRRGPFTLTTGSGAPEPIDHPTRLRLELADARGRLDAVRALYANGDHDHVARALQSEGLCLESVGRATEALSKFEAALAMHERVFEGDHPWVANDRNRVATCLMSLGRTGDALPKFEGALVMSQRLYQGDHPHVANSMGNVAICLDLLGRPAEGLPKHEEALAMSQRLHAGDHRDVAAGLNRMARCLELLGRTAEARSNYEAVLVMARRLYQGDHPHVAASLANLAVCLDSMGRADLALSNYDAALAMSQRLYEGDHPYVATSLHNMANCLVTLGRPGEALLKQEAAVAMRERLYGGDHPQIAASLDNMASCLASLGRSAEALLNREAAAAMGRRLDDANLHHIVTNLGWSYLDLARADDAAEAFAEAITRIETRRAAASAFDERDRASYFEALRHLGPFAGMVAAQRALGRPAEALRYMEQGRARALLDLLERSRLDPLAEALRVAEQQGDDAAMAALRTTATAVETTQDRADQATHELALVQRRGDLDVAARGALRDELDDKRRAALNAQRAAMRERSRLLKNHLPLGRPASPEELRQVPTGDELLIVFAFSESKGSLFLVPPAGSGDVEALDLAVGEDALSQRVDALLAAWSRPETGEERGIARRDPPLESEAASPASLSATLFEDLFPPAAWQRILAASRIYLVPDGALHRMPVEALVVDRAAEGPRYWIDVGPPVSYAPSGTVLLACRANRDARQGATRPLQILALGNPVYGIDPNEAVSVPENGALVVGTEERSIAEAMRSGDAMLYDELVPLPGTQREVEALFESFAGEPFAAEAAARHADIRVLLGDAANEIELFRDAPKARILHLATHYLVDDTEYVTQSALALTRPRLPSDQDDGFLRLTDLIERWRGRLDGCELVVLSACETARGRQQKNEGIFAMPWGFFYTGVPAVIVSHWPVSDDSTAALMADFYRRMNSGAALTKLDAFSAARRAQRERYPSPFHWAPFVYLGDPR